MVIGRGAQCALRVDSNRVGRQHSVIEERDGHWWVSDLQSSYGTWLTRNGALLGRVTEAVPLQHGDLIGLYEHVRIELDAPEDELATQLERSIIAHPDDDAAWAVYADRLLELGDPRGERIRSNSTDWKWPGHQVSHALSSSEFCTVEWARGHLRRLTLRHRWARHERPFVDHCLLAIASTPISRFLLDLELELQGDFDREAELQAALVAAPFPALRRFRATPERRAYRLRGSPLLLP